MVEWMRKRSVCGDPNLKLRDGERFKPSGVWAVMGLKWHSWTGSEEQ